MCVLPTVLLGGYSGNDDLCYSKYLLQVHTVLGTYWLCYSIWFRSHGTLTCQVAPLCSTQVGRHDPSLGAASLRAS